MALISTARKINTDILHWAERIFNGWDLDIVPGANLFKEDHQFAGTDEERLSDLQLALDDKDIKAVLCARGGYGTSRLIDQVNWSAFKNLPKWVMGYSDICVLHGHLQHLGYQSLHCSMPVNFRDNTQESLETMRKAIFGERLVYPAAGHPLNRKGKASGQLVGGNLSILYSIKGTSSMPPLKGNILFIEDLDEYLYHVDRMMVSLKRGGVFEDISGLVVGGMTDMKDNENPFGKSAEEIVSDHCLEYDIPVCFGFPAGHQDDNRALIMGSRVELSVGDGGAELRFSS